MVSIMKMNLSKDELKMIRISLAAYGAMLIDNGEPDESKSVYSLCDKIKDMMLKSNTDVQIGVHNGN